MGPRTKKIPPADWRVYLGDKKPRDGWQLPEPPPWRPRRTSRENASAKDARPPLSHVTENNGKKYESNPAIIQMVNAAIHLRRPLLVTGAPGSGKSTLADSIAFELNLGEPLRWPVNSRSTLRDALYSYDAIGRAQYVQRDMKHAAELSIGSFIELGPLGTAMLPAELPRVLLIDEIDKADIDLPNDLLNILDEGRFHIPELSRLGNQKFNVQGFAGQGSIDITNGQVESYEFPLVILTSNGEREFSAPFLRRCLRLEMPDPFKDRERLHTIVEAHLGSEMANQSQELIGDFMQRAKAGEILATDQLLNAVQLVMGQHVISEDDRAALRQHLRVNLGKTL